MILKIIIISSLLALIFFICLNNTLPIRKLTGKITQLIAPQYGYCHRCLMSWTFTEGHNTRYGNGEYGLFPLCEKCWKELKAPEARLPYYRQLWEKWQSIPETKKDPAVWKQIKKSVLEGK
ncbi:MAG: hypothetical protein ACE5HX_04080 [bacterium]